MNRFTAIAAAVTMIATVQPVIAKTYAGSQVTSRFVADYTITTDGQYGTSFTILSFNGTISVVGTPNVVNFGSSYSNPFINGASIWGLTATPTQLTFNASDTNAGFIFGNEMAIWTGVCFAGATQSCLGGGAALGKGVIATFYPSGSATFDMGGSSAWLVGTATVPEPASWALLIAGFGMTGAVLRRRQRVTA